MRQSRARRSARRRRVIPKLVDIADDGERTRYTGDTSEELIWATTYSLRPARLYRYTSKLAWQHPELCLPHRRVLDSHLLEASRHSLYGMSAVPLRLQVV